MTHQFFPRHRKLGNFVNLSLCVGPEVWGTQFTGIALTRHLVLRVAPPV